MDDSPNKEDPCVLPRLVCPLCKPFNIFWKLGLFLHVLSLVAIALALVMVARVINEDINENRVALRENLAAHQRTYEVISQARNATLENRAIQTELRGMLSSWIQERRRAVNDRNK